MFTVLFLKNQIRFGLLPVNVECFILLQMNWTSYFTWMFEDIDAVDLDFAERDSSILIVNRDYLTAIFKLIASTPPYVVGRK